MGLEIMRTILDRKQKQQLTHAFDEINMFAIRINHADIFGDDFELFHHADDSQILKKIGDICGDETTYSVTTMLT